MKKKSVLFGVLCLVVIGALITMWRFHNHDKKQPVPITVTFTLTEPPQPGTGVWMYNNFGNPNILDPTHGSLDVTTFFEPRLMTVAYPTQVFPNEKYYIGYLVNDQSSCENIRINGIKLNETGMIITQGRLYCVASFRIRQFQNHKIYWVQPDTTAAYDPDRLPSNLVVGLTPPQPSIQDSETVITLSVPLNTWVTIPDLIEKQHSPEYVMAYYNTMARHEKKVAPAP